MSQSFSAEEVLAGDAFGQAVDAELAHGNGDLIKVLRIAGLAGPYRTQDSWRLLDADGRVFINAGGYSAVPFGDRYPPLIDFLVRSLQEGTNIGLPQQAASEWRAQLETRLVQKLASVAPVHADSQVFFSNSGAEAIESAVKFVSVYRPKARYFINFERAFHGKTLAALSLTPNPQYQRQLRRMPFDVVTLPFGDADAFAAKIKELGPDHVAGVVIEPIQGEAGVRVPPTDFLRRVDEVCKKYGILVVADEIQTGLGRAGYWFASVEWGGMTPDIITLAKPLGGGLTAVGATIARRPIFRRMLRRMDAKQQSNTFGGNSLAMAIGLKSLDIIEQENLVERARRLGEIGKRRLDRLAGTYPRLIAEARSFGMMFALQFQPITPTGTFVYGPKQLNAEFTGLLALMSWQKAGILGNFSLNASRSLRLTPALTMPEPLFDELFDRLEQATADAKDAWHLFLNTSPHAVVDLVKFACI